MPRRTRPASLVRPSVAAIIALAGGLSACGPLLTEGAGAGAGIAGAGIAGTVTKNAAVTSGIGLGVNAAALAGVKVLEKRVHTSEQDQIAEIAGPLDVGATAPWSISHRVKVERNEHGTLTVSRVIRAGDLDCKEVVFSVDRIVKAVPQRAFYTTTICRDGETWKWASAEPATARWGALQ
ncbi:MAG: hypothetical protein ACYDD1_13955 [Caulobacteraceae bacterium]